MPRLTKIDELVRELHFHLDADDECFYLREYTSRGGYEASDTNQLIHNLKKSLDRRGQPDFHHKNRAIEQIAAEFRSTLSADWLQEATLVPIPPSAVKGEALYDDRMTQVLTRMTQGLNVDVRELLIQRRTMVPAHMAGDCRPSLEQVTANYMIDEGLVEPRPRMLALFDDVLTAGTHFKAAKYVLAERFPNVSIVGVFVARRIFPANQP